MFLLDEDKLDDRLARGDRTDLVQAGELLKAAVKAAGFEYFEDTTNYRGLPTTVAVICKFDNRSRIPNVKRMFNDAAARLNLPYSSGACLTEN